MAVHGSAEQVLTSRVVESAEEEPEPLDAPAPAPPESPACLEALPFDVLLHIARLLDGRELARLTDCTSRTLRSACDEQRHEIEVLWSSLYFALTSSSTVVPACSSYKKLFVKPWAASQRRCPKCGRQATRHDGISRSGEDVCVDVSAYMHLCDWLVRKPR